MAAWGDDTATPAHRRDGARPLDEFDNAPPRVNWWGVFTLLGFLVYFAIITWGAMLVVQAWRAR